jgi:ribosome biogenesis protein SSF1/2
MVKKRGKRVRKQKLQAQTEDESLIKQPHCFVVHRGDVSNHVQDLERDVRSIFEPFTASQLKVRKYNSIKDYLQVCGIFGVTNIWAFGQTKAGVNLRVGRVPRGPSVTFR